MNKVEQKLALYRSNYRRVDTNGRPVARVHQKLIRVQGRRSQIGRGGARLIINLDKPKKKVIGCGYV